MVCPLVFLMGSEQDNKRGQLTGDFSAYTHTGSPAGAQDLGDREDMFESVGTRTE